MPEKLIVGDLSDNSPLHFAIVAFGHLSEEQKDQTPQGKGYLDIEFKIDGVDVPFSATIEEIYSRMEKEIDRRAAIRAMEVFQLKGLTDLAETIEQSRWKIKQQMEESFGVTLD